MNKVFLIGNLTRDPELTETANGTQICRFSLAVKRGYKNADGEYETDFFNCQAWRGVAEAIARYAHKGNKLAVTGSLQNRSYEDSNGVKRTVTEIQVQDAEFLTPRQSDSDVESDESQRPACTGKGSRQLTAFDDDSDIPF